MTADRQYCRIIYDTGIPTVVHTNSWPSSSPVAVSALSTEMQINPLQSVYSALEALMGQDYYSFLSKINTLPWTDRHVVY